MNREPSVYDVIVICFFIQTIIELFFPNWFFYLERLYHGL